MTDNNRTDVVPPFTASGVLSGDPLDPHGIKACEDSSSALRPESPLLLRAKDDHYDGIIIDPNCLPSDVDTFVTSLRASLAYWKSQCRRGVWLKIPIENADLVPAAVKEGFVYHHAELSYLMLTYWIPETPSTIPANASHQVGIGAFVINEKREILVVQERGGSTRNTGVWKIPTGVVNQAEDILVAAKREVKEETGVDATFIEVLSFRHGHNVAFGKSDLFFLCMLHSTSSQITIQETEIKAAMWMPLDDFCAQKIFCESSMLKKMVEIAIARMEEQYRGFSAERLEFGFQKLESLFYYNKADLRLINPKC